MDISVLQCASENEGCMFQAASNFNGVECISDRSTPDERGFATNYIYDHTQGPAASISAGAAALARVHAAFYDPAADAGTWGQTGQHQVEMLADTAPYFAVRNGYVCNTKAAPVLPRDRAALEKIEGAVRVLVHARVETMFGRYGFRAIDETRPRTISQTFCAAMNLAQGASGYQNAQQPDARDKARLLLRAAYRGTLLAAELHACPKVFLTLIGGGVFGNNFDDIIDAVRTAHAELFPVSRAVKEVHVVFFRAPNRDQLDHAMEGYTLPWMIYSYEGYRPYIIAKYNDK